MLNLSADDHARVSAAIAAAEAKSDGEIIAITSEQSDAYHDVGLHWAVLAMVAVLAYFAALPGQLEGWYDRFNGWSTEPGMRQLLTLLLFFALLKFLVVLFLLKWRPLRMLLTPGATKTRRVRRRAIMLFKTGAERRTIGRTGILRDVKQGRPAEGIVAAVGIIGDVLAEHFPKSSEDSNEIPDKLIEL